MANYNDFTQLCCFPNGDSIPGLTFGYVGNYNSATGCDDRRYYIRADCDILVDGTLWSGRNLFGQEYSKASRAVKAYRLGLEAADRLGDYKKSENEDRYRLANLIEDFDRGN